jgi:hypothetical protein
MKADKIYIKGVELRGETLEAFNEQSLFTTLGAFVNYLVAEQMCLRKRLQSGSSEPGRYALYKEPVPGPELAFVGS